jgi:hypothetical protein
MSARRTAPVLLLAALLLLAFSPAAEAAAHHHRGDRAGKGKHGRKHDRHGRTHDRHGRKHHGPRHHRVGRALKSGSRVKLTVVTRSPAAGQTVSGSVTWQVEVSGAPANRVDFAVDGTVRWTQRTSPYLYGGAANGLDTRSLGNGSHTLSATAYGPKGARGTARVVVNVANDLSPAPDPEPTEPAPAPEKEREPEPAPEPESEPAPAPGPPPSSSSLYWGATIGSHLTGDQAPWDMSAVARFEEEAGKRLSLVQFFQPFSHCTSSGCSFYGFPTTPLENVRLHGAIPVLSWSSQSIPSSLNEPDYQLSDLIAGRYDSYIRGFAEKAKAWGHPFFLRFNWEMNGRWFPWHEGVNGNRAGEFVTAWRHVHDIFTAVGAANVSWVWCPNVEYSGATSMASVYPGDAYVDWTGLDGYNWGTNPSKPDRWKTFDQVYRTTYQNIVGSIAPGKPMMIGEVASSEYGGSKAGWIREMLSTVPAEYRQVHALLWFDKYDSSMDWPIETSSSAVEAFAEGIGSSAYLTNEYAALGAGAIQPPG